MQLDEIKKVHFIGVGGIGLSAVAKLMLELGKEVSGSDLAPSVITNDLNKSGARIFISHDEKNLPVNCDLVIYSDAVRPDNVERLKAKTEGITELSYFEFLSAFSKNYKTIAVTGTNGKTTTTALLGKALVDANVDPTVIIGSRLEAFGGNLHVGSSDYFVVEADEYRAHMLNFDPWSIILTNIDVDHLDFYHDLEDIISHFQKFINKLPPDGYLFYASEDQNIKKLKVPKNSYSCGFSERADYCVKNLKLVDEKSDFEVYYKSQYLDNFNLALIGDYNVLNALFVIAFCHQLKLDLAKVKKSLSDFTGLWRRFEILGYLKNLENILVISDYTHHPTAIAKTLKAARELYKNRRIILAFQPHQHNRTINLFNDFVTCFQDADFIILNEIYDVAGRISAEEKSISSLDLVNKIISSNLKPKENIIYSPNFETTKDLIMQKLQPNDLLVIMGAGDIDNIARELTLK